MAYTQNWDKNGNIYYTDENGQVVNFKVNPFTQLANKAKATAYNVGSWINETNPNSEAYKQKVSAILGLATAPLGLGATLTGGIAKGLVPVVGRKIAQNMAQGISSGVVGGAIGGGAEAGLNDRNIAIGGLQGTMTGGLLGGLGGYGLGKVAQKLNTQTAWHGSPYKFDKFSNEAIGTGEGAQAHGYGHYAAKNKDVAQNRYAIDRVEYKNLPEDISRRTEVIGVENTKKELRDLQKHYENLMGQEGWGAGAKKDFINKLSEIQTSLESLDNPIQNKGQLYKLSIPKDDVMLREDLPLSQQPIKVQESLKKIQKKQLLNEIADLENNKEFILKEFNDGWASNEAKKMDEIIAEKYLQINNLGNENLSYKNILKSIADYKNWDGLDKSTKKTIQTDISNKLNKAGIKGISYNGGIDGEANVIFNPDDIDIIPYYDNPTSFKEKFINLLNR